MTDAQWNDRLAQTLVRVRRLDDGSYWWVRPDGAGRLVAAGEAVYAPVNDGR